MPRYILLVGSTRQGIEKRKGSPARIEEHKKNLKAAGIDVRAFYHMLGPHDGLMIADAPNGAAVGKHDFCRVASKNWALQLLCPHNSAVKQTARQKGGEPWSG